MDNSKDIHFSEEAKRLFRTTPPLLIRSGNLLVCLFVSILVVAGFFMQVPYRYTTTIYRVDNGIFLIENRTKITNGQSFEIIRSDEKKITIRSYRFVCPDGIPYIQFTPESEDNLTLNDFGNTGECVVQYSISLSNSYLDYLLHGI